MAEAPAAIVALGGGAFARAENRELIRRVGVSVWLDAPFELCWRRILEHDIARPLAPDEASARARYEARLPLYGQSDVRIEVSAAMSAEEIVELIIERLAGSRSQAEERAWRPAPTTWGKSRISGRRVGGQGISRRRAGVRAHLAIGGKIGGVEVPRARLLKSS